MTPWVLGLGVVVSACSGGYGEDAAIDAEETAQLDEALTKIGPPPNYPPENPFSSFTEAVSYDAVSASTSDDPAVCWKKSGYVILYRDSSNKMKMLSTDTTGLGPEGQPGGSYRSSRWYQWQGNTSFNSRPACVNLDPVDSTTAPAYKLLVAGRATNNKFVTTKSFSLPDVGSAHLATPSPEASAPWNLVSNTTYAGGPAMSASKTKNIVAISGVRASDNRVVTYTRPLSTFDTGSWSSAYVAGPLPTGWTATGTPAIAMTGAAINMFTVVVRATSGSQSKYFFTYFSGTNYGVIVPDLWLELDITNPSSDPALEFSTHQDPTMNDTLTLAFRKGTSLYQTSGLDQGLGTFTEWNIGGSFVGSPAIKGISNNYNPGEYYQTIVGRKSNGKLFVSFVEYGDFPLTE